jgi:hypothetical protein
MRQPKATTRTNQQQLSASFQWNFSKHQSQQTAPTSNTALLAALFVELLLCLCVYRQHQHGMIFETCSFDRTDTVLSIVMNYYFNFTHGKRNSHEQQQKLENDDDEC